MLRSEIIQTALDGAWHRQTAEASLERWQQICQNEKWGEVPEHIEKLVSVFGASWYFTRFVFYRGRKSAQLIDTPVLKEFDYETILAFLSQSLQADEEERQFEWLRSLKNQAMLQLLLYRLSATDSIAENERALTLLSIATLNVAMRIVGIELDNADNQVAVLGMGRIAGHEMNFGSDLDLIFLFNDHGEEFRDLFSEKIRYLLRHMALSTATGILYEIDMRLRPHGTSGALVTSVNSFLDYHSSNREVWERQMMTRCMPIIDQHGMGKRALQKIKGQIYSDSPDQSLAGEILGMRTRVEDELGTHRGKFDVKRGRGGIMDIDFLTHYLQIRDGSKNAELQNSSTRTVLSVLGRSGLLLEQQAEELIASYDFFKQIEACLRLFDLKSINTFPVELQNNSALVRAMDYRGADAANRFLHDYGKKTEFVHALFNSVLTA